jgi:cytochrome c-type biogenesis protein CcmH/NrfG
VINLDQDFPGAESVFAIANTPLFLVRKLRADPAVQELARENTEEEILSALRAAVRNEPQSARDYVVPYVYLIALAIKNNTAALRKAIEIRPPYADWYDYIANYLVQSSTPTVRNTLIFPPNIAPVSTTKSSTPFQRSTIHFS